MYSQFLFFQFITYLLIYNKFHNIHFYYTLYYIVIVHKILNFTIICKYKRLCDYFDVT